MSPLSCRDMHQMHSDLLELLSSRASTPQRTGYKKRMRRVLSCMMNICADWRESDASTLNLYYGHPFVEIPSLLYILPHFSNRAPTHCDDFFFFHFSDTSRTAYARRAQNSFSPTSKSRISTIYWLSQYHRSHTIRPAGHFFSGHEHFDTPSSRHAHIISSAYRTHLILLGATITSIVLHIN